MNIAVCIKQTADTTTRPRIADDGRTVAEDGVQWIINPHDEAAVERALKLKEAHGGEVTVVSLGPARIEKSIREALAMGADRAIRLDAERIPQDPSATARALAAALEGGGYDLVLTGQQAVDDDAALVPLMLGHALGFAAVTGIEDLEVSDGRGTGLREAEGGRARVSFALPAVVGCNRRLNEPRYPNFKNIMQAKKKPIDVQPAQTGASRLEVLKLDYPPEKSAGKVFNDGAAAVPEVVRLLHEEAKVL
ncbi:MAG: electron transfer flavoprotein subunit beta/FixA family protein [Rhodothermales bacterium]|nr:electron transfer flavoprotein subunit beta/FixA family protein [Rhodothermales bacterium]